MAVIEVGVEVRVVGLHSFTDGSHGITGTHDTLTGDIHTTGRSGLTDTLALVETTTIINL
jgi:hypothetical protein